MNERLQKAALVGRGFTSDVYAWGNARVLKLFHNWVPVYRVEREYKVTRIVHAAGLPAPATYELLQIEDRLGIVFDRVDGLSMLRHVQARPWTLLKAVRQLAELHAQIHRCPAPFGLPTQREWIANGIDKSSMLSSTQKQNAQRALAELPDGTALCHGDFHPENILFTSRGPIVIDWETATCGDPLGDVARTSCLIQTAHLPRWSPFYMHQLLKCSRVLLHRVYMRHSIQLHAGSREQIQRWAVPFEAAATSWRIPEISALMSTDREEA